MERNYLPDFQFFFKFWLLVIWVWFKLVWVVLILNWLDLKLLIFHVVVTTRSRWDTCTALKNQDINDYNKDSFSCIEQVRQLRWRHKNHNGYDHHYLLLLVSSMDTIMVTTNRVLCANKQLINNLDIFFCFFFSLNIRWYYSLLYNIR